ncbi:MAG TPA: HAMP domain-containing sensor histidine kinase [Acidimicrobiales bacterium]|nr:HAMP domain-containing sensor histidine kinase [Acidimicrobiales bacterium]
MKGTAGSRSWGWASHYQRATTTTPDAPPAPWPSSEDGAYSSAGAPSPRLAEAPDAPGGVGASPKTEGDDHASPQDSRAPRRDRWLRDVKFRSRVTLLVAAAVGVAVAMAAAASYVAVSRQLEGQANSDLQSAVDYLGNYGPTRLISLAEHTGDEVQIFTSSGVVDSVQYVQASPLGGGGLQIAAGNVLDLTSRAKQALASGSQNVLVQTVTGADGKRYLVATVPYVPGQVAVQIGYPVTNMDHTLSFLRLILILLALCGVGLAAMLGWAVGKATMAPVEDLTLAAEHVAQTQDLTATIDASGNDELGRLARSFNEMLSALAASRQQQAQLVGDAGHELRTPLTSLRTNIEVLMRTKDLSVDDRDELLADIRAQLEELSNLVGDLVDLAREDERPQVMPEPVAFSQIVEHAVERAQRRALSVHFDVSLEPGEVLAQPALLERAVMNVLDNAAKWSPVEGHISVVLRSDNAWHLTVTDQGPGIAPEDLPHIFDRFYRAQTARSMPGSGLGLAIANRAITAHGGTISVGPGTNGGTRVEVVLPLGGAPASSTDRLYNLPSPDRDAG